MAFPVVKNTRLRKKLPRRPTVIIKIKNLYLNENGLFLLEAKEAKKTLKIAKNSQMLVKNTTDQRVSKSTFYSLKIFL